MNPNVCYSPIPALHDFVCIPDECGSESRLQILSQGLLRSQMNLSRIIMYAEDNNPHVPIVRDAMNIIADIYDAFSDIEASRLKYIEAMKSL